MSTENTDKSKQRYLSKSRATVSKYIQKLEELPCKPKELEYFENILKQVFIDNKLVRYSDNEKFIGTFCMAMPPEIICAAGARPLRLCSNNQVGFSLGNYETPDYACSLVKSVIGSAIGELGESYKVCDMFIVPVTCDCKKRLTLKLAEFKPTESLFIPLNREDDDGMNLYIRNLKNIADKISEITGVKVTREALVKQIKLYADVQKEVRRLIDFKENANPLIYGSHAMAVMNSLAYDDISNWAIHLKKLNEELQERKDKQEYLTRKRLPRILLTGSPLTFPNIKIPLIIEEQGGLLVSDDTCLGDRFAYDSTAEYDSSLNGCYRALANKTIRPCSCPVFPDIDPRLHKINEHMGKGNIDGIIYHITRGCIVNNYEFEQIENLYAVKGIPVLRIESDLSEEDVEQIRIRIEAFIEMIKFKRKRN